MFWFILSVSLFTIVVIAILVFMFIKIRNQKGESMMENYRKKGVQPMVPWSKTVDMSRVSVSIADSENGSPQLGDMIAIGKDPTDQWLVSEKFFKTNYEIA